MRKYGICDVQTCGGDDATRPGAFWTILTGVRWHVGDASVADERTGAERSGPGRLGLSPLGGEDCILSEQCLPDSTRSPSLIYRALSFAHHIPHPQHCYSMHDVFVKSFTHLKDRPRADQALQLLQRIASLVKPVMRKHGWVLPVLSEFFPDSPNLLGEYPL